jgi:hypothetical protein
MVDKISLLNSFLCSANLTTFQDWGVKRSWHRRLSITNLGREEAWEVTTSRTLHSLDLWCLTNGPWREFRCQSVPTKNSSSVIFSLIWCILVKQKPFNYGSSHTREFGAGTEEMLGE